MFAAAAVRREPRVGLNRPFGGNSEILGKLARGFDRKAVNEARRAPMVEVEEAGGQELLAPAPALHGGEQPLAMRISVYSKFGLIAVASLGGALTEMTDASASVYSKLKRLAAQCDSCRHINSIRPWSV